MIIAEYILNHPQERQDLRSKIHAKYQPLLPNGSFLKGCINFWDKIKCP